MGKLINEKENRIVQLFNNGTNIGYYAEANKIVVTSLAGVFADMPQLRTADITQNMDVSAVASYAGTFRNDVLFNAPLNIGNSVTNCAEMLAGCTSFNSPIAFPDGRTGGINCANMMRGCTAYNQPTNLPSGVTDMDGAFNGCVSLSADVNVPDSVVNARNAFRGCTNLLNGYFGNSLINMAYMYAYCGNITNIQGQPYGYDFDMLNTAAHQGIRGSNMSYALAGMGPSQTLSVVVPYSVNNAESVIYGGTAINGSVTVQAMSAPNAMAECREWSGTVEIGSLTQDMQRLLYNARAFNSTIAVPYNARRCSNMLRNCQNFNASILLNGGDDYDNAFRDCKKLNQNIVFPPRFINMTYGNTRDDGVFVLLNRSLKNTFRGCDKMKGTIYLPGNGDYTLNDGGSFFLRHNWIKSDGNAIDATLCYYNAELRMPVVDYETGTVSIVPKMTINVDTLANTIEAVRSGNKAAEDEIVRRLTMGEDAQYDQGTINTGAITVNDLRNAINNLGG